MPDGHDDLGTGELLAGIQVRPGLRCDGAAVRHDVEGAFELLAVFAFEQPPGVERGALDEIAGVFIHCPWSVVLGH